MPTERRQKCDRTGTHKFQDPHTVINGLKTVYIKITQVDFKEFKERNLHEEACNIKTSADKLHKINTKLEY